MGKSTRSSFRVGPVKGYLRGSVWYLCYHEAGRRRQVRATPCRKAATQLAAQVNAQLSPTADERRDASCYPFRRRSTSMNPRGRAASIGLTRTTQKVIPGLTIARKRTLMALHELNRRLAELMP